MRAEAKVLHHYYRRFRPREFLSLGNGEVGLTFDRISRAPRFLDIGSNWLHFVKSDHAFERFGLDFFGWRPSSGLRPPSHGPVGEGVCRALRSMDNLLDWLRFVKSDHAFERFGLDFFGWRPSSGLRPPSPGGRRRMSSAGGVVVATWLRFAKRSCSELWLCFTVGHFGLSESASFRTLKPLRHSNEILCFSIIIVESRCFVLGFLRTTNLDVALSFSRRSPRCRGTVSRRRGETLDSVALDRQLDRRGGNGKQPPPPAGLAARLRSERPPSWP